jgi:APA family basic amino acid/polyamine antiporter
MPKAVLQPTAAAGTQQPISSRGAAEGPPRVVGRWDLTWQAVNIMIGTSILVLPGVTLSRMGGWAPLAVLAAAAGISFVVLTFAEAAGRYRDPGGMYRYAGDAFGEYVGTQAAFLCWAVRATASAAIANVFVTYFAEFWPAAAQPAWRIALLTAAVVLGGVVNLWGIRQTASLVNVLTVGKLLPLAVVCAAGAIAMSPRSLLGTPFPPSPAWARSVLLWVFALGGFEATLIPAGEARDPMRDGPPALLRALAIVAVTYVAVQFVVCGVLSGESGGRPVGQVARVMLGEFGALLVAAGAVVGAAGHLTGSILASARITFAMADRGSLPAVLARLHPRFKTPTASILLFAAAVWILAVTGSFVWNASISAVGRLLLYAVTASAVLRLRKRGPSAFVVPAWSHAVGFTFCVWLFSHQTIAEAIAVGLVLIAGTAIWLAYGPWRRSQRVRQPASSVE